MKRNYYLFPLMAMTALSLTLAGCDDKKSDETATTDTTAAPVAEQAMAVHAEGANAYATAEGATTGAVFLTLMNPQGTPDKLVGVSTPVAGSAELHQSATDANGVVTMTKVEAIELPPAAEVRLEPNGYHIMLLDLNTPLVAGTPFDITLDFENAPDITLPVTVAAPAAPVTEAAPMDHTDHGTATDTTTTPPATTDESPAADMTTPTDAPAATDTTTPPTTTTAPGDATPDTAPTSSAPDASTTAPTAQ